MEFKIAGVWLISILLVLGSAQDMEQCMSDLSICAQGLATAGIAAGFLSADTTAEQVLNETVNLLLEMDMETGPKTADQVSTCSKYYDLKETFACYSQVYKTSTHCSSASTQDATTEAPGYTGPSIPEMLEIFGHLCDPGCVDIEGKGAQVQQCMNFQQAPTCPDFADAIECLNEVGGCCPLLQVPLSGAFSMVTQQCPDLDPQFTCTTPDPEVPVDMPMPIDMECMLPLFLCAGSLMTAAQNEGFIPTSNAAEQGQGVGNMDFMSMTSMAGSQNNVSFVAVQNTFCSKYAVEMNKTFSCVAKVFETMQCFDDNPTANPFAAFESNIPEMIEVVASHLCEPGCAEMATKIAELEACSGTESEMEMFELSCTELSTVVPCVNKVAGCCPILQLPFTYHIPMIKQQCPDLDPKFTCDELDELSEGDNAGVRMESHWAAAVLLHLLCGSLLAWCYQ